MQWVQQISHDVLQAWFEKRLARCRDFEKQIQCILDYPAMLGNLFPKSWPNKKSIYRRVPAVHHLHHT